MSFERMLGRAAGLAVAATLLAGHANGQAPPREATLVLESSALGEARPYLVHTPPGYEGSTRRYPVVYLLDGPAHFYYVPDVIRYLAIQGRVPEMIVVAIPNTTDRTRDLTPPSRVETPQAGYPTAGGADRFLQFLADELIPHIDSTYRTESFRVLVGHSYGGLFAAHTLLTRPELFRAVVAISPALWWNRKALVDRLAEHARTWQGPRTWLYLTSGSYEADILNSVTQLSEKLKAAAPGFWWRFKYMPAENHGSIPFRSTYDGLEAIFTQASIPDSVRFGIWQDGSAGDVLARLTRLDARLTEASEDYGLAFRVPEAWINQWGYGLLGRGDADGAVQLFRANVSRFPESANAYDSLGDGYLAAGDSARAREAFAEAIRRAELTGDPVLPFSQRKLSELTSPPR